MPTHREIQRWGYFLIINNLVLIEIWEYFLIDVHFLWSIYSFTSRLGEKLRQSIFLQKKKNLQLINDRSLGVPLQPLQHNLTVRGLRGPLIRPSVYVERYKLYSYTAYTFILSCTITPGSMSLLNYEIYQRGRVSRVAATDTH